MSSPTMDDQCIVEISVEQIQDPQIESFNMTRHKEEMSTSSNSGTAPVQLPPGPSGLPYVGSLFEWKGPHTNLEWTKRYGPIYQVRMGNKHLVYLNTLELVEKYLEGRKGELYLDRPMGPGAIAEGLLFGSGETWKKNKKAFMKSLYTVTFSKDMEDSVQCEANAAIEKLQHKCNKPIKIGDIFIESCANAITGLLLGGCLPEGAPERKELTEVGRNLEGCDLSSMLTQISMKHPRLRDPLSKLLLTNIVDIHGTSRRLQTLLRQWIRETRSGRLLPISCHTETSTSPATTPEPSTTTCPNFQSHRTPLIIIENNDNVANSEDSSFPSSSSELTNLLTPPRNDALIDTCMSNASNLAAFGFTDKSHGEEPFENVEPPTRVLTPCTPITEHRWTFKHQMSVNLQHESILQRILKQPEFKDVTEEDDAELLQSLIDMFFGGVTSTLSGLEFILVHLTRNPDMQRTAQEEIDEQVSQNDGHITWSLYDMMPYVQACVVEGLRLGSITPSSLPHVASEDTEIEGYRVPKGTYIMGGIYSLHRDPQFYLDPHEFRPQRHLNKDRQFTCPKSYKPFGIGARRCVGDKMALMELFIYTVYILRHFELKPVNSKSSPSLETHMRIINRLKDFRCILHKRNV